MPGRADERPSLSCEAQEAQFPHVGFGLLSHVTRRSSGRFQSCDPANVSQHVIDGLKLNVPLPSGKRSDQFDVSCNASIK